MFPILPFSLETPIFFSVFPQAVLPVQVPYFASWVSEIYCSQMFLFESTSIFTYKKLCFYSSLMTLPALSCPIILCQ